jgi:hypothetical protein
MPCAALDGPCHVLHDPQREDLQRLAAEAPPPALMILGYAFPTLHPLAAFGALQVLKIQGAPRLAELAGTEHLASLREFVLSTPPGSDGSGKCIEVGSLKPLGRLAALERLVLLGVRPRDRDLAPIMRMQHLREIDIGGVPDFTLEDYARLAAALPHATGPCLAPYVEIAGAGQCRKCRGRQVLLNGTPPRVKKWLCPTCNSKLLAAHVARWEAVTGRPYAATAR